MKTVLLLNSVGSIFAWMNGYSTLLHNIAPGKYIVIKVEYGWTTVALQNIS